ncbi:MAG TPA: iron chelate uptake ABC transporter family permease subunit [Polyangia bacterium]|nr:iron chelate uptake ABC transporter family permease subunit [Polyangia bacterium]
MSDLPVGFWESWALWRDIVAIAVIAAGLCSFVGVYIVLKRIVFVSAAMSQMSGVGVSLAFFLCSVMQVDPHGAPLWLHPLWYATAFAAVGAALFSLDVGHHRRLAGETVVGLAYLVAAASVILVLNSPRVSQEAHEVNDLLYGNAVVATAGQLAIVTIAAAVVATVHLLFGKEFLLTSFDSETARTLGLRTRGWSLLLFATFAVTISVSTRAIGALPVFAFMVIPPAVALLLVDRLWQVFAVAVGVGVLSAFMGYWASFRWSLPTGASMVVVAALFLVPGLARLRLRGNA